MREWRFDLEVLTPMFVAGANQARADVELRPPSIRGELRYWFRALAGPCVDYDVRELQALEGRVFGSTEQASLFTLRVGTVNARPFSVRRTVGPGLAYLGYGPIDYDREARGPILKRGCLGPGTKARLTILPRPGESHVKETEALAATLWTWGQFGALGARARRGWGSIRLVPESPPPDGWPASDPYRVAALADRAAELSSGLAQARGAIARLAKAVDPALPKARQPKGAAAIPTFFVLDADYCTAQLAEMKSSNVNEAMERVGCWLKLWREEHREDARLVLRFLDGRLEQQDHERTIDRACFGLPLGFHFPRDRTRATIAGSYKGAADRWKQVSRRASPLMIRFYQQSPGQAGCLVLFLHSRVPLLPAPSRLVIAKSTPPRPRFELSGVPADLITKCMAAVEQGLSADVRPVVIP